jgi:ribosome-associated translation inhibitor RaiA
MQIPVQVSFKNLPVSDAVEAAALRLAARLNRYCPRITRCDVTIASPHHHHRKGTLYSCRMDITVPGGEIVVNRDHPLDHAHEDVYMALHDAFDAARRLIEDHVRRMRHQVKTHAPPATD